jgi:endoglucanase
MKNASAFRFKAGHPRWWRTVTLIGIIVALSAAVALLLGPGVKNIYSSSSVNNSNDQAADDKPTTPPNKNPLFAKSFFNDPNRDVVRLTESYRQQNNEANYQLSLRASRQPVSIWLNGPHGQDPEAVGDIETVAITSRQAKETASLPVYILYAVPIRDACASYSRGGFGSFAAYLSWLEKIKQALGGEAVFVVEPDAVPQTIRTDCLTATQTSQRYAFLKDVLTSLKQSPLVLASYLDAGHSEWFPDHTTLVEPLKAAGVDLARGVSVNVSNFVATAPITDWANKLVTALGGQHGVLIDTSRNGQGSPDPSIRGDARWCNPPGRGLGTAPNTQVASSFIDAYFWGKIPGESDGDCFGNPPAGTFSEAILLDLARLAQPS